MAYTKGKAAPNRGIAHSEETRNKISESCKKSNMGKWNIGRSHIAWNKGIAHTKEHIEKQRISIKKYYQTHTVWNKGLKEPYSKETLVKMSLGLKKYWTDKKKKELS